MNDRIITVKFKIPQGNRRLIPPLRTKERDGTEKYFQDLKTVCNITNNNDFVVIAGDMNTRVKSLLLPDVPECSGEHRITVNYKRFVMISTFHSLKITNIFFLKRY